MSLFICIIKRADSSRCCNRLKPQPLKGKIMATEIISKRCPQCKQNKSLSDFHKSRREKDGHCSWCKSCMKASNKTYRQTDKGKAVNRKKVAIYFQTSKGKAKKTEYLKSPRGRAVSRKAVAKYHACNPNYPKANHAVTSAIRNGRLPRVNTLLCHYCPEQAEQYHHWHGYEPEYWLDVVPACIKCHNKEHKKSKEATDGKDETRN